jgi:hypothetical protein
MPGSFLFGLCAIDQQVVIKVLRTTVACGFPPVCCLFGDVALFLVSELLVLIYAYSCFAALLTTNAIVLHSSREDRKVLCEAR